MKKINTKLICAVAIIAIASTHSAYAQSPFNKLKGLAGGKKGGGGDIDVEKVGDELVQKYMKITQSLVAVQVVQLKAIDKKDLAADLEAQSKDIGKTPGKKEVQKVVETSKKAQKEIDKLFNDSVELSEEVKKELAKSIPPFVVATVEAVELPETAKRWADGAKAQMKGFGALKLRKKLAVPLYIAPKIPKDLKVWTQTATRLVGISKKHGIKLPKEATSALPKGDTKFD